jgi:hypothetical protein
MLVGDDRILQCALSLQQQQQQQQQQHATITGSSRQAGVVLLTNDKVLALKAHANTLAAASLADLQWQQAAAAAVVSRLLQLAGVGTPEQQRLVVAGAAGSSGGSSSSSTPAVAAAAVTGRSPQACRPQPHHAAPQQLQQEVSVEEGAAAAARHLQALQLALSPLVLAHLQSEFEGLWLDVVINKPPWDDVGFVEVLNKHWGTTLEVGGASVGLAAARTTAGSWQQRHVLQPPDSRCHLLCLVLLRWSCPAHNSRACQPPSSTSAAPSRRTWSGCCMSLCSSRGAGACVCVGQPVGLHFALLSCCQPHTRVW